MGALFGEALDLRAVHPQAACHLLNEWPPSGTAEFRLKMLRNGARRVVEIVKYFHSRIQQCYAWPHQWQADAATGSTYRFASDQHPGYVLVDYCNILFASLTSFSMECGLRAFMLVRSVDCQHVHQHVFNIVAGQTCRSNASRLEAIAIRSKDATRGSWPYY